MTDQSTGFQVAPVQEDAEMANIRSVFDKALNAVVAMSQLSKDVESLRIQVTDLTTQVTRLRAWNEQLDETLHHVRTERDTAQAKVRELTESSSISDHTIATLRAELEASRSAHATTTQQLHDAERYRDDAELKVMELEDQLGQHKTKLSAIYDAARSILPPPAPEPIPTPMPAQVIPITEHTEAPPVPVLEPTPTEPVKAWWETDKSTGFGS